VTVVEETTREIVKIIGIMTVTKKIMVNIVAKIIVTIRMILIETIMKRNLAVVMTMRKKKTSAQAIDVEEIAVAGLDSFVKIKNR